MKTWIMTFLSRFFLRRFPPSMFKIYTARSHEEYAQRALSLHKLTLSHSLFEKSLIPPVQEQFVFPGYCYVCKVKSNFLVDFCYSHSIDGVIFPNWRERLVCPFCNLNNRMRAIIHIFHLHFRPDSNSIIYITEQLTPLYHYLKKHFFNTIGSEYLTANDSNTAIFNTDITHQDLTHLSYSNNIFDYILCFDVLEHIPDYRKAFNECHRCLKPGGILYFSVPFLKSAERNLVRAQLSPSGDLTHFLPPEYHGDPLSSEGCLTFYHFGWELLEDLREIGFEDPQALIYWSKDYAYLGGDQFLFSARKPLII